MTSNNSQKLPTTDRVIKSKPIAIKYIASAATLRRNRSPTDGRTGERTNERTNECASRPVARGEIYKYARASKCSGRASMRVRRVHMQMHAWPRGPVLSGCGASVGNVAIVRVSIRCLPFFLALFFFFLFYSSISESVVSRCRDAMAQESKPCVISTTIIDSYTGTEARRVISALV